MKKTDLIQKLKQLDGLTPDERATLIDLVNTRKKYGLVWEDKPEEVEEQLRDNLPVLREVKDKAILNGDENPNHILIEGDNLHALTALTFTHEGRIDVIYIDPPYNTGNKDFKYHDAFKDEAEFVDKEHKFRHSTWLSFMYKRLKIAKNLLSDKGAIFISIDDNEQAQLKILCDEVFGENNFIGNVIRATGTTTGQDTGGLGKAFDYILVYSKIAGFVIGGIPLEEHDLKRYNLTDKKGNFSILQLRRTGGEDRREDRPTMYFPIIAPDGSEIYPIGPSGYESRWRVGPDRVKKMLKEDLLYFKNENNSWKVYYKYYAENRTKRPSNLWNDLDGNKKAQIEIKDVFIDKVFDTPKPIQLLNRIIQLTTNNTDNFTVLDFFAGSGTTLHATMLLNAEDGGNRQCILVTNNENNICEEVTYERNKRIINGYTNAKGEVVEGLSGNNLRYYKSEFVGRETSVKNKKEITRLATELLCIKENIYTEQKAIGNYQLNTTYVRCFQQGDLYLLVIYDEEVIEQVVEVILNVVEQSKDAKPQFKVYVFSNGQYPYTEEFEDVLEYVTLCALPDAIYKAYQNVLPKRQRKVVPELEEPTAEEVEESLTLDNEQDLFS